MTPNTKMAPIWPNLPTPNFMSKIAKIIEEVRARTCINKIDAEAIEKILQDELTEYYRILEGYYEEEYYNTISSALSSAYDNGYADGQAKSHSAV